MEICGRVQHTCRYFRGVNKFYCTLGLIQSTFNHFPAILQDVLKDIHHAPPYQKLGDTDLLCALDTIG